jgi:ABC-type Fe3+-hydroxamate transport system substrate-binding protein
MKDQLKRKIQLQKTPKRIISLVPSQTELLVDLGLSEFIVGITKFCIHPENLRKEKTVVGGTKNIKIKKIKALQPDIILCNKEENSLQIIESLEGIAPIHISAIYTLKDCYELIEMYGEIFSVSDKANQLIEAIENERKAFKKTKIAPKKVAYFIWKNPWMVAASNTFIDVMLGEAGFINVFKDEKRYPEIALNNLKLNEADLIMLSSEPFPFKETHIEELRVQFLGKKITLVDGELFSWYGSRLFKSYHYFKQLHN